MLRVLQILATALLVTIAASVLAQTITAIEYYHAGLDHYFVTASLEEIDALDTGRITGWRRTGQSFPVLASTAPAAPGLSPVCRFYGAPAAGLDSHFYSASPPECAAVARNFPAWKLESADVFQVYLPDPRTGACPAGTMPVYRSWNARPDSNHRYTANAAIQAQMIAQGAVAEGYGDPPVAMCVPSAAPPVTGPGPACALVASSNAARVGQSVELTANCNNAPTSYAWTGCTSTGPVCTAAASAPGPVVYTVTASNAAGSGSASTTVFWQPQTTGTTSLTCSIAASAASAPVNTPVTLTASCVGATAASFVWSGCASTGPTCTVAAAVPGPATYSVQAIDQSGIASAPAFVTITWTAAVSSVPLCSLTALPSASAAINTTVTLQAACSNTPDNGYQWSNCTSSTATCFATAATAGRVTYGVRGVSPTAGAGAFTFLTVTWH